MDKLEQSSQMAKRLSEEYGLSQDDFWLLERKGQAIAWIIKHNGCLKIARKANITLQPKHYELVSNSLDNVVIFYRDPDKNIFEVGEASTRNCQNGYPYAMALKRVQDRTILKLTGLAEEGAYSDVEADDFKQKENYKISQKQKDLILRAMTAGKITADELESRYGTTMLPNLTKDQVEDLFKIIKEE